MFTQSIFLQATALSLYGDMGYPEDTAALLSILGLSADGFQPLLAVSVGSVPAVYD